MPSAMRCFSSEILAERDVLTFHAQEKSSYKKLTCQRSDMEHPSSPGKLRLVVEKVLQFLNCLCKFELIKWYNPLMTQTATVSGAPILAFEAVVAAVSSHPQGQISTSLPSQSHSSACSQHHFLVAALRCQPPWSAKGRQCRWALVSSYDTNIANEMTFLRETHGNRSSLRMERASNKETPWQSIAEFSISSPEFQTMISN